MQVQQQQHSHLGVAGACRKALGSLLEGVTPEADRLKVAGDGRLPRPLYTPGAYLFVLCKESKTKRGWREVKCGGDISSLSLLSALDY